MSTVFRVEGMTCSGCANSLKKAVARHDPSLTVAIDPATGLVTLERGEAEAAAQAVAAAAEDTGFVYRGPVASAGGA